MPAAIMVCDLGRVRVMTGNEVWLLPIMGIAKDDKKD